MRVALADDSVLFRSGLERLLEDLGVEVVSSVGNGPDLITSVARVATDVAVVDIRMPPTFTDEGLQTAQALRSTHPDVGVLLLSTYATSSVAARLLEIGRRKVGYLVKDRVDDPRALRDALFRLQRGECVIDPDLVGDLVEAQRHSAGMESLTPREQRVLHLMAEGRSNNGIGSELYLSVKTVETHVGSIFTKLRLPAEANQNRRVLAVLSWLQCQQPE